MNDELKTTAMKDPTELPSVFAFLDYRAYLKAWFDAKQAANPRYSHRAFARRAGQKSPSLLLHIIQGKRNLTQSTREAFVEAMRLPAAERSFFAALVDLDQARSDEARNDAWSRISAQRRFRDARRIEGAAFDYLSHWYIPAVRELASREDFQDDPAWIAKQLRPRIKPSEASTALETLVQLGLLVEGAEGLESAEATVATAPEIVGLAVHNYHRGMIARAAESISSSMPDERHLLGVTVGIPISLIPTLKEELNAYQARLLDLCDSAEQVDAVYQLNLQLFPLSEPKDNA
jgi:uncharacterized protein (TIGR02147 family)